MVTARMTDPGRGSAILSSGSGDTPKPNPTTNPFSFNTPGEYIFRPPADAATVTIEQWAGGAGGGAAGGTTSGGKGGGAGAYAKYHYDGVMVGTGCMLTVTVAAACDAQEDGHLSKVVNSLGTPKVSSAGGLSGDNGATGGANTITAGSGLTVTTNTAGGNGANQTAGAGGKGGSAGGSGGAGGTGGSKGGDPAEPGTAPGGGGGGAGTGGGAAPAGGAHGKITISWA